MTPPFLYIFFAEIGVGGIELGPYAASLLFPMTWHPPLSRLVRVAEASFPKGNTDIALFLYRVRGFEMLRTRLRRPSMRSWLPGYPTASPVLGSPPVLFRAARPGRRGPRLRAGEGGADP